MEIYCNSVMILRIPLGVGGNGIQEAMYHESSYRRFLELNILIKFVWAQSLNFSCQDRSL